MDLEAWRLPGFTIPGRFIHPPQPGWGEVSARNYRWASYMAGELHQRIQAVAGPGHEMYWRDEWEVERNFRDSGFFQWAWVPTGQRSWYAVEDGQRNELSHMRICFRDERLATLARLSI